MVVEQMMLGRRNEGRIVHGDPDPEYGDGVVLDVTTEGSTLMSHFLNYEQ